MVILKKSPAMIKLAQHWHQVLGQLEILFALFFPCQVSGPCFLLLLVCLCEQEMGLLANYNIFTSHQ